MQMNKHYQKYLYESIMKQVAKTVKTSLNESFDFDNIDTKDKNKNLTNIYKAEAKKQRNIIESSLNYLYTILDIDDDELKENIFENILVIQKAPDALIGEIVKNILSNVFDSWADDHKVEAYLMANPPINKGESFKLNTKFGTITVKLDYEEGDETFEAGYEYAYIYDKNGKELTEEPLAGFDYDLISDFIYKKITPKMKQELKALIEKVLGEEKDE